MMACRVGEYSLTTDPGGIVASLTAEPSLTSTRKRSEPLGETIRESVARMALAARGQTIDPATVNARADREVRSIAHTRPPLAPNSRLDFVVLKSIRGDSAMSRVKL